MPDSIAQQLAELSQLDSRDCISLMSGTSGDGLDVALVAVRGSGPMTTIRLKAFQTYSYPPRIRTRLFAAGRSSGVDLAGLNFAVTEFCAKSVLKFIRKHKSAARNLKFISAYNISAAYCRSSSRVVKGRLAIVEPAILAERTGLLVVDDMRTRDIAAGGTGAPLSPYADWVLFRDSAKGRAVLNIGGIANVAVLPAGAPVDEIVGFDTGPGNMIIDGVVRHLTQGRRLFDKDGALARQGVVNQPLLKWMLAHPFISSPPPKAAGYSDFGDAYVQDVLERAKRLRLTKAALVATVTACTVEAIVLNFQRYILGNWRLVELIVGGGGVSNPVIMKGLRAALPLKILRHEDFGIPSKARETLTWAILANDAIMGKPNNVPRVTGATHRVVMGRFTPAS